MDGDGGLGIRNWAYYDPPLKGNLGLQLMSPVVAECDTKPLLTNGGFLHRDCGVPEPPVPMEFVRDGWISHRDSRILHVLPVSSSYATTILPDAPIAHTLQMLHPTDPPRDNKPLVVNEISGRKDKETPSKKNSIGRPSKSPKPKKPKKVAAPREASANRPATRGKNGNRNTGMVINGIDLDISGIPTPVCSCTGTPQQCYRWGIGGWQSACCTTSISLYPLPMSTKRRGARIAGRKMSQGAFKKVLEKLAGEGYNLSNPIDLRTYWAKHGTNKFVTIR